MQSLPGRPTDGEKVTFFDNVGRLRRVVSRHILRRFGVFCSLGFPQLLRVFFVVWSWWRWRYWSRMACYATVSEGKPRGPGKFHYTAISEGVSPPAMLWEEPFGQQRSKLFGDARCAHRLRQDPAVHKS